MNDSIFFDHEAQYKLKTGVQKLSDAVSITMGPRGKLVLIERNDKPPHLTKDGATVAKNIFLNDRVEDLGARLLKQASENTAMIAGDGSTTSTVLAKEIYFNASKVLQTGIGSPSEFTKELNNQLEKAIEYLTSKKIEVSSNEEIKQIAQVSANGDDYIGELISKAMSEVGSSGLVTVEKSKSTQTDLKLVKGVKIERGFVSPYFVNQEDKSKCNLDDPVIFITSNKIDNVQNILPILEKVHSSNKSLLIIANEYEQEVIQTLVANSSKGLLNVCAIKSPFYGEKRNQILQDLATCLDTKVFHDLNKNETDSILLSDLGSCGKIEITSNTSIFIDCKNTQNNEDVALELEKQLDDKNISKEEQAYIKQRLVINKGVVAVLSIGAHTESELLELFDRVDDALHATKAAIEQGFLPGGGISLAKTAAYLIEESKKEEDLLIKTTAKILADSCYSPIKNILSNAEKPVDFIIEKIKDQNDWNHGYDVRSDCFVDMIEKGIIDPFKVTITALKNAVSVSNSLLSIGCVVLNQEQVNHGMQLVQLSDDMY